MSYSYLMVGLTWSIWWYYFTRLLHCLSNWCW